jgi:hypothetical protein
MMKKEQHPDKVKQSSDEAKEEKNAGSYPFIVPAHYFDELPQRVLDKISKEQKEQKVGSKMIIFLRRTWIPMTLAASIALFLFLRQPHTSVNNSINSDSLALSSQSNEYDPTYADEALLIEELAITDNDETQIDFMSMSTALNSSDTTGITIDDKIQYLLDENYDTDLITEL